MASAGNRNNLGGSKGFDFATSDDILCSYDDFNHDSAATNGTHSDPGSNSNSNSAKEFHKTRMARTPMFPASTYISPEESSNNDVISSVEKTMKRSTDNIMRFLEGISSRLSQLELYCYNLDKSIGEMRSEWGRDHEEADAKLKSLEKHVQEIHRSVQILRDKQELADTQKELAKLQLSQKESPPSTGHSQRGEEKKSAPQASDTQNTESTPEVRSQQLALALPHQVAPQPQQQPIPIAPPPPQGVAPAQSYYIQPSHIQNQPPQGQYMQMPPQLTQSQANQAPPQHHPLPQYQQQWSQQVPPQQQAPQPPSMQPQIRPSPSTAYSSYLPNQPANPPPTETLPSSMPMQVPYSGIPQPGSIRSEPTPYGYGGPSRPIQQQPPPPQQLKNAYGSQVDIYAPSGPHPPPSGNAYTMYQNEDGRVGHHPQQQQQQPHYAEGNYHSPASVPPQYMRNHPYNELIEKLVGMGYRGEHVSNVIQRLEENGQPVDFNAVLDILNGNSSGGSQRGWRP